MKRRIAVFLLGVLLPFPALAQTSSQSAEIAYLQQEFILISNEINQLSLQMESASETTPVSCTLTVTPNISLTTETMLSLLISWNAPTAVTGSISSNGIADGYSSTANAIGEQGSLIQSAPKEFSHVYEYDGSFKEAKGSATCAGTLFLDD